MPAKVRDEPRNYERLFIYVGKNPEIVRKLDQLCAHQGDSSRAAVVRALIESAYTRMEAGKAVL